MPSVIIVMQNGHPTATVFAPVARACSVRSTLTRFPIVSSRKMRPPPAPQQKPFFRLFSISTVFAPRRTSTSRGGSTVSL